MMKKRITAVLLSAMLMAMSVNCVNAEGTQEEILFWHSYSEGEEKIFKEQVLEPFEEMHPEIKVNAVRMPYEGMDEQFVTAVSGDAAPDVMRMDLTWVPQMSKLGALEKLDTYEGFEELKAGVLENTMSTNLYDGSYYGMPLNSNTTVAVFNKTLLAEYGFDTVPETMDEWLEATDKTDPQNEKWLFAVQGGDYSWTLLPFLWTLGGTLTDETFSTATGYLNSSETVAALECICSWYSEGIIGPAVVGEEPDGWGGMEGNNYGMIVEGPWYYNSSSDTIEKTIPALIPSVEGRSISILGGESLVMTSTGTHKDAAWTFIQFMMGEESQLAMAEAGMIPTTEAALAKVDTTDSPYVAVYMEQLQSANPRTPSAQWPSIKEVLNETFEMVLRGTMTAQDALDAAAIQIDELLVE